ncbi:SCO family protein [Methylobacterium nodulans]|uniref:Electron transport protein SCO1/SenC n=1 Tax=Methylobacterium nodulans (strain LMG 21967 / CNCM I-2342 / ORS 2060) TaxID=460265 RepID=B8IKM0_METNO|nr:SCO family protein [Methylobacterium nodulans]ACL56227.1 electron transport protein SCO1/SenC [Methylobacterium nodulans ORS 2060]
MRIRRLRPCAAAPLALGALVAVSLAHEGRHDTGGSGPGREAAYAFPLAAPGTYRLPPIKRAAGGAVLDEAGRPHDLLRDVLQGRTTVLALIYTRCGDACPLATADMARLQDLAAQDRPLSRRMQLVTLSFDPEHDTPAVMHAFAQAWRSPDRDAPAWRFLTAPDRAALAPVLAAYGQRVDRKPEGTASGGPLNHLFRAFLIDADGQIRNIYSLDFFDPGLVLNDVRSLLLDAESRAGGAPAEARR